MKIAIIHNKSGQKIDLSKIFQKMKPYYNLVSKDKYPIEIIILKKKNHLDRSNFNLDSNLLTLKFNTTKQSKSDIEFVVAHEFWHFVQNNNEEIKKTCLSNEHHALMKILKKTFNLSEDKIFEVFHDLFPVESQANVFATFLTGHFNKRHSFKNILSYLKNFDII